VTVPPEAFAVFGDRFALAQRYADFLATAGIERGLLGPREVPRLWERHLLNCAPVTELLPRGTRIVDVGTGAGLPGLVIAIRRPDVRVDLVESLQRRVDFLAEAAELLGLREQVRVVRGRAEDPAVLAEVGDAPFTTARAVAPLDRLVKWCLPLLATGGRLLALKGASAAEELTEHRTTLTRLGGSAAEVVVIDSVSVVVVERRKKQR
jgi:16S rRNA (guanine527-N7)-methyltransferase